MKKINKKRFSIAIITIAISIALIIETVIFANDLKEKGLASLFTTNVYEEAFEIDERDIKVITVMEITVIVGILGMAAAKLEENAELLKLEIEERRLLKEGVRI
ncbi:MAG: hypothetical protein J6B87_03070 [Clostridia bacterium]|nr:hypothetical protein [Clostridia bacterium]